MTYTTKQGDTWDLIAYQQMGSIDYTDILMWANRCCLNYYTFPAGVVLIIPEIVASRPGSVPPWKKAIK